MNKKILIGCFMAAVIIILASYTSVVGINSTGSIKKDSPLFSIRTQRAIEVIDEKIESSYIGEHKVFYIPKRAIPNNEIRIQLGTVIFTSCITQCFDVSCYWPAYCFFIDWLISLNCLTFRPICWDVWYADYPAYLAPVLE